MQQVPHKQRQTISTHVKLAGFVRLCEKKPMVSQPVTIDIGQLAEIDVGAEFARKEREDVAVLKLAKNHLDRDRLVFSSVDRAIEMRGEDHPPGRFRLLTVCLEHRWLTNSGASRFWHEHGLTSGSDLASLWHSREARCDTANFEHRRNCDRAVPRTHERPRGCGEWTEPQ